MLEPTFSLALRAAARLILCVSVVWLAGVEESAAQISAPAIDRDAPTTNLVSVGASVGTPYRRDAVFWGLSTDYTRVVNPRWSFSAALTYDQEHDRRKDGSSGTVNSFTAVGTVNYTVLSRLTLTTGLGRGFLNDDNPERDLRFTGGDVGTGVAGGVALPGRWGLSVAWEWNITQKEPSISVDVTYGWGF